MMGLFYLDWGIGDLRWRCFVVIFIDVVFGLSCDYFLQRGLLSSQSGG